MIQGVIDSVDMTCHIVILTVIYEHSFVFLLPSDKFCITGNIWRLDWGHEGRYRHHRCKYNVAGSFNYHFLLCIMCVNRFLGDQESVVDLGSLICNMHYKLQIIFGKINKKCKQNVLADGISASEWLWSI